MKRQINCAGVVGRPNVDWCETHQEETLRANVVGALVLADCAAACNVHMTVFTTGCIYKYDDAEHALGSGVGFKESDPPNFDAPSGIMVVKNWFDHPPSRDT